MMLSWLTSIYKNHSRHKVLYLCFLTKALNQAVALDILIKLVLCLGVKQLLVDTHVFMPTALCISFNGGVGFIVHMSWVL